MRVLFVSDNRCRGNLVPYPLGVAHVAAATRAAGHEVKGLDLMFSDEPARDVLDAVDRFEPDCVGLTIRNVDNQDPFDTQFFVEPVRGLVAAIREAGDAEIVLGGAGFSMFPIECLEYLGVETGVVGEGEIAFPALLEALAAGRDPAGLPSIAVLRGDTASISAAEGYVDPGLVPHPDREAFPPDRYDFRVVEGHPFVSNLQSRRGCHLHCIYCSTPWIEGRELRTRDARAVADELEELVNGFGIGTVAFVDSLFNHPLEYSKGLSREIASRGTGVRWMVALNPMGCDAELFALMSEAGCFAVSIGNESGSDEMLTALRKEFTVSEIEAAVRAAQAEGLKINCFLLLGGPGETRDTVEESVEFVERLAPEMVTVTPGIRIYPGCELHRLAIEEGVVAPDRNLLEPVFYVSRGIEGWIRGYTEDLVKTHEGWTL